MGVFVGLVARNADAHRRFGWRLADASSREQWKTISTSVLSLAWTGLATRRVAPEGVILGQIFTRESAAAGPQPDGLDAAEIAASRGAALAERHWGAYVAVLPAPDSSVDLTRAPLGSLPCYLHRGPDGLLFGSNAALLLACAGHRATVDVDALVRHLAFAHLRRRETCLAGIEELAGGERATVSPDGVSLSILWSPWTWASAERAILDPEQSSLELAERAKACIAALAAGRTLLKLSGGLDSSIVAACLAAAKAPFEALNLVTDDPAGDERGYARAVARHLGAPLREVRRDPALFDLERSPAQPLPRPSIPGFRQVSDRVTAEAAAAAGAAQVLDGGGGDNVFCALQSAAPVADCLLARDGRRHLIGTAVSIAAIAQVSAIEVLRRAALRALRPRRRYRWPVDQDLLSAKAAAAIGAPQHPWLCAPAGVLPGKAAHVALLAAAQSYVEGIDPEQPTPMLAPLLAQPLVEHCLRIPSWQWFDRGRNRAAARRAFRGALPRHIVGRRTKGTPDSFVAQLFETHRPAIRTQLLDGMLARNSLVDRVAIEALTDGRPLPDQHLHRLMTLFDAEAWASGWSG